MLRPPPRRTQHPPSSGLRRRLRPPSPSSQQPESEAVCPSRARGLPRPEKRSKFSSRDRRSLLPRSRSQRPTCGPRVSSRIDAGCRARRGAQLRRTGAAGAAADGRPRARGACSAQRHARRCSRSPGPSGRGRRTGGTQPGRSRLALDRRVRPPGRWPGLTMADCQCRQAHPTRTGGSAPG